MLPSTDSTVLCIRRRQCIEVAFDSARTRSVGSRSVIDLRERVAVVTGAGPRHRPCVRVAAGGVRRAGGRERRGVATDGSSTAEDPAADVVAEIAAAGGEAIAHRGDIGDAARRRRARAARARHVGPARHRHQQRGLRPAADGLQPRRRRVGRRDPRAPARHVRRVAARVPALARAGEGARHDVRAADQHRDRAPALRRRGPVELRRGQGRASTRSPRRSRPRWRRTASPRTRSCPARTRGWRRSAGARQRSIDGRRRHAAGASDLRDPVHVAELGCFLASPEAARDLRPDVPGARRDDRARADVAGRANVAARRSRLTPPTSSPRELPLDAGPKPADRPPPEWTAARKAPIVVVTRRCTGAPSDGVGRALRRQLVARPARWPS